MSLCGCGWCLCSSVCEHALQNTLSYLHVQRVLVGLGRHDEALVVAERACTRAFIDLLLERQAGSAGLFNGTTMDLTPITIEQMTATVARQGALVLCFSVAAGSLYSWLLTPTGGESVWLWCAGVTVGGEENKEEKSVVKKGRRFEALMCVQCMQSNA